MRLHSFVLSSSVKSAGKHYNRSLFNMVGETEGAQRAACFYAKTVTITPSPKPGIV